MADRMDLPYVNWFVGEQSDLYGRLGDPGRADVYRRGSGWRGSRQVARRGIALRRDPGGDGGRCRGAGGAACRGAGHALSGLPGSRFTALSCSASTVGSCPRRPSGFLFPIGKLCTTFWDIHSRSGKISSDGSCGEGPPKPPLVGRNTHRRAGWPPARSGAGTRRPGRTRKAARTRIAG